MDTIFKYIVRKNMTNTYPTKHPSFDITQDKHMIFEYHFKDRRESLRSKPINFVDILKNREKCNIPQTHKLKEKLLCKFGIVIITIISFMLCHLIDL